MPRYQQIGVLQRRRAVNRRLRSSFARGDSDLPLFRAFKVDTLAPKLREIGRMSGHMRYDIMQRPPGSVTTSKKKDIDRSLETRKTNGQSTGILEYHIRSGLHCSGIRAVSPLAFGILVCIIACLHSGAGMSATVLRASDGSISLSFGQGGRIVAASANGSSLPFVAGDLGGVSITGVSRPLAVAQTVRAADAIYTSRPSGGAALLLSSTYTAYGSYIALDAVVSAPAGSSDVPFEATFTLPIKADGWTWSYDLRRDTTIAAGETLGNLSSDPKRIVTSIYPLGTISNGRTALTIAAPLDQPRIDRIRYTPQGLQITYNLGVSRAAVRLRGTATFSLVLYSTAGQWGMRGALEKYYTVFPQFFVRRIPIAKEGIWYLGSVLGLTPSGEPDVAFAHDYGIGNKQVAFGTNRDCMSGTGGYYYTYTNGRQRYAQQLQWLNAVGGIAAVYMMPWRYLFLPSSTSISAQQLAAQLHAAAAQRAFRGSAQDDAYEDEAAGALDSWVVGPDGTYVYGPRAIKSCPIGGSRQPLLAGIPMNLKRAIRGRTG